MQYLIVRNFNEAKSKFLIGCRRFITIRTTTKPEGQSERFREWFYSLNMNMDQELIQ
jgi:hypothetical protein